MICYFSERNFTRHFKYDLTSGETYSNDISSEMNKFGVFSMDVIFRT